MYRGKYTSPIIPFGFALLVLAACGGGSSGGITATNPGSHAGTLLPPPTTSGNAIPIVIDAGPVATIIAINTPYVSVTVCSPGASGATAACQTIDHVLLDTGSSGLRLLKSALYANLDLPQATNGSGQAMGECSPFAVGTTWGSVRLADVYLAGEIARSVPIQDIGDAPGGATAVPADCSGTGAITDDQASLDANGILGIGLFVNDCDICLTTAIPAAYYTCTSTSCKNSVVSPHQVVRNPVALFPLDNNGTLIDLPSVPLAGAANAVTGTLIFGIGTQANNVSTSVTAYPADSNGNFRTTYSGSLITNSFIDSGSNALFFDDASIPTCPNVSWTYCPKVDPAVVAATTAGASGSPSTAVSVNIVNVENLGNNVIAANIGGSNSATQFDWGLPFFFGRPVFTALAGAGTPYGNGPYWAY
jgi:hypothetical protein